MLSRAKRSIVLAVLPAVLAVACGGGNKATTTTTTTIKDTSAQSGHYHAGERCSKGQAFAYAAQRFTCVNGRLRHKAHDASPATVHHHSNTTTGAPGTQGYLPGY